MTHTPPLPKLPDITYTMLREHLGPVLADKLCDTIWKDGIDIEEPGSAISGLLKHYAAQAVSEALSQRGEAVQFLADGCRFRMSFIDGIDQDGEPTVSVKVFNGHRGQLDGLWVALVPAENDMHRKMVTAPQPAQPEFKPPSKWTEEEIEDGYKAIRWVMCDGVYGRPSPEDYARDLQRRGEVAAQPAKPVPMTDGDIEEMAAQEQFLLVCDGIEELTCIVRAVESFHHIKEQP